MLVRREDPADVMRAATSLVAAMRCGSFCGPHGAAGEVRFVNRLFRVAACSGEANERCCASSSPMQ